jgi:hypothetical protein
LPCILRSGPYGELSFDVYNHAEFPGIQPERLASFHEEHFNLRGTFKGWDEKFKFVCEIRHNEKNRKVLEFYKLPKPRSAYDYSY